eukprot:365042-Chlamydomonas_euryale.AAC.34
MGSSVVCAPVAHSLRLLSASTRRAAAPPPPGRGRRAGRLTRDGSMAALRAGVSPGGRRLRPHAASQLPREQHPYGTAARPQAPPPPPTTTPAPVRGAEKTGPPRAREGGREDGDGHVPPPSLSACLS